MEVTLAGNAIDAIGHKVNAHSPIDCKLLGKVWQKAFHNEQKDTPV